VEVLTTHRDSGGSVFWPLVLIQDNFLIAISTSESCDALSLESELLLITCSLTQAIQQLERFSLVLVRVMDGLTGDIDALLASMGMAVDPTNSDFVWSTDMGQNFDPVNTNTLINEQARYYQDGHFAQVEMAQTGNTIQTAFGNRSYHCFL
jgi:hypothetical protein